MLTVSLFEENNYDDDSYNILIDLTKTIDTERNDLVTSTLLAQRSNALDTLSDSKIQLNLSSPGIMSILGYGNQGDGEFIDSFLGRR